MGEIRCSDDVKPSSVKTRLEQVLSDTTKMGALSKIPIRRSRKIIVYVKRNKAH